jgi:hypothetical protein
MSLEPEEVKKILEENAKKNTPLPGNICNVSGCGGKIVKEWRGYSYRNCKVDYSLSFCGKCGKTYPTAMNVPIKQE